VADVLTREAAADEVGVESCDVSLDGEATHIIEPRHIRPVPREHLEAVRVVLDLPYGMPETGPLKAEFETADAAEERPDAKAEAGLPLGSGVD
jgi:hypothetical protein